MKILTLGCRYPSTLLYGDTLRLYHLVSRLIDRHEFDFLGYGCKESDENLAHLFRQVELVDTETPDPKTWHRLLAPWHRAYMGHDDRLRQLALQALEKGEYDLLWMDPHMYSRLAPFEPQIPVLLDVVDDWYLTSLRHLRHSRDPWTMVTQLRRTWMSYLFERKYYPRAELCTVVAEADAEMLKRIAPEARTVVIHNGVDTNYFQKQNTPEEPATIIFEGSMNYEPNADTACRFVEDIFPRVKEAIPEAKFLIVGKDPSPAVQDLAGPDIEVTGYVDDVRPYLNRAALFACPMRLGGGIKNKLLQAWAMSKPVVASTASCGGLKAQDGENIVIQDDSTAFANAVISLLRDPALRQRLGAAGRATVQNSYSWDSKALELERAFELVVGAKTPTTVVPVTPYTVVDSPVLN